MFSEKVDLTYDQIQALKSSIHDSNLSNEDKALLKGLIDFNGWLQQQLLEKKISISRLKTIIFGEPQCKDKHKKGGSNFHTAQTTDKTDSSKNEVVVKNANPDINVSKTNHGCLSHQHHLNREKVTIKHQLLKAGDLCPTQCGGKLWNATPGTVIKISGKTTLYQIK